MHLDRSRPPGNCHDQENLATTGFSSRAEVKQTSALEFLKTSQKTFDLIYIAPPQYKNLWVEAMRLLAVRPELLSTLPAETEDRQSSGLAIVQVDPKEYATPDFGELHEIRQKRYGSTLLVFYERASGTDSVEGIRGDEESNRSD